MHMLFTVFSVSEEESDIILACSISLNNFITNKCKISTKVYIHGRAVEWHLSVPPRAHVRRIKDALIR